MFMSCFTTQSRGFTKFQKWKYVFFKSVLSSRSENTEPVISDHVKSSETRNETPLQL